MHPIGWATLVAVIAFAIYLYRKAKSPDEDASPPSGSPAKGSRGGGGNRTQPF